MVDPAGVQARKAGRIRRRVFYAAGVNHIWAFDQHDKWKRFGLRLHMGVEPFTGYLLWITVWWSNSNPKLVARQYFEAARRVGGRDKHSFNRFYRSDPGVGLPMLTQSDHGTENYNIAYAQTHMRQKLDPDLVGTLQHSFMRGHTNIKPERAWGRLRDTWSKGFEDMLNIGITNQWYNTSNVLDRYAPFCVRNLGFLLIRVALPSAGSQSHSSRPSSITTSNYTTPLSGEPTNTRFFHKGSQSTCSTSPMMSVHSTLR